MKEDLVGERGTMLLKQGKDGKAEGIKRVLFES